MESVDDAILSQYSVLVVDDEEDIINSLRRLLRCQPYNTIFANSGANGLNILAETDKIAVVVSDQKMPGMTGAEFLALSREHAPDAIRILLTGCTDAEIAATNLMDGIASQYLSKPWDSSTLTKALRDGVSSYHCHCTSSINKPINLRD